jgi:ribosomal protein S27AE
VGYEFVAVAVLFGIVTGIVGRSKGGSFLLWFVIGTVLPGFGLAAAILTRSEQTEPERQCPRCNNTVKLYVQICPRCGAELYLPDPSEVRMPPPKRRRLDPE